MTICLGGYTDWNLRKLTGVSRAAVLVCIKPTGTIDLEGRLSGENPVSGQRCMSNIIHVRGIDD